MTIGFRLRRPGKVPRGNAAVDHLSQLRAVKSPPPTIFNPRFGKILPSSMESAGLVEMGNSESSGTLY